MVSSLLTKSPIQTAIIVSVIVFVFLNVLLPFNFALQTEMTQYPFRLGIALNKSTYKTGELINITWVLTNIGEENITLYNSRDILGDFKVQDGNFNYVHSGVTVLAWVFPYPDIESGGNITRKTIWTQTYDYEFDSLDPVSPKHALPGIYYISGLFFSLTYNITLETAPLRIEIVG